MVRYGGPRFEFITTNQCTNHRAFVCRENNERVRSIVSRRQAAIDAAEKDRMYADTQRQQQEEAEQRSAAAVQAARALRQRRLEAEQRKNNSIGAHETGPVTTITKEKIDRLAAPKKVREAAYGCMMYGRCMEQRGREVEFPLGRAGATYCPGVDRDRIVPARPDLTKLPPWVGSYSTHRGFDRLQEVEAQMDEAFYLGGTIHKTPAELRERRMVIDEMQRAAWGADEAAALDSPKPTGRETACDDDAADRDDLPSIFSHGSSNGPIADMGMQYLNTNTNHTVTRNEVQRHLSQRGERAKDRLARSQIQRPDVASLPLIDLTHRVVRLQREQQGTLSTW